MVTNEARLPAGVGELKSRGIFFCCFDQPASLTPWGRTQAAKLALWWRWSDSAAKKCSSMSSPASFWTCAARRLAWPARRWYTGVMTSKDLAIKTIQELPDSATWEDIEERVRFLAGIDKGLADIKAGKVVPHEEVKESLKRWLGG